MGMNFPNSPLPGQVYTPVSGYSYVFLDGVWRIVQDAQSILTADTRNRIVNGAMQISQENGDTQGSTSGYYVADQWKIEHSGLGSFLTARGVVSGIPQIGFQGVKASLAASDFAIFNQLIEGININDFQWGTASAKQAVLCFDAYSQLGGEFAVSIRNGVVDRSFLAPFTIPAGAWTPVTVVIPGDTTGTWPIDNSKALSVGMVFATGSTFHGVAGWQAGNKLGFATTTNAFPTLRSVNIRKVGLYLDPLATGVPPRWQMPDEAEELRACQRYFEDTNGYTFMFSGAVTTGILYYATCEWKVDKRVTPSVALKAGNQSAFPATVNYVASPYGGRDSRTSNLTSNGGWFYSNVTVNARM